MKLEEFVNKGFKQDLPIYLNKVTIINYNQSENQVLSWKSVSLKKYNLMGYQTYKCYKHIMKISNI